jgi:hypothetical protein
MMPFISSLGRVFFLLMRLQVSSPIFGQGRNVWLKSDRRREERKKGWVFNIKVWT